MATFVVGAARCFEVKFGLTIEADTAEEAEAVFEHALNGVLESTHLAYRASEDALDKATVYLQSWSQPAHVLSEDEQTEWALQMAADEEVEGVLVSENGTH